MRTAIILTFVVLLAGASTADAAGWSRPSKFRGGSKAFEEPVARVAVARDGTSIATFARGRYIYAVMGNRRGRFGSPQRLGRWSSITPAVAAAPGGRALAVWAQRDGVHVAVRPRSGRRLRKRRIAPRDSGRTDKLTAQADPRGGWFVLEAQSANPGSVRAFTLGRNGTLALRASSLGSGSFGLQPRPVRALAVDATGHATAVLNTPEGPVFSAGMHHGHFGPTHSLGGRAIADPSVTAGRSGVGNALIAATNPTRCGDGGACSGQPVAAVVENGSTARAFDVPLLDDPGRAFGPSIAPLRQGRAALVYSEKTGSSPFNRSAPVKAVTLREGASPGRVQTLTSRHAAEPIAATLSRGRVLVIWSGRRGWGASLSNRNGAFRKIPGVPGPPPSAAHSNPTNRAISTAGSYALVGWSVKRTVRLSLRRF